MHPPLNSGDLAAALALRFQQVRQQTELLARPLSAEDCQLQSMPDASPAKWHLAHVTWFFETFVLERFEADFTPFNAGFRVLFNSYYNGIGDKHPRAQRGLISRPTLQDVRDYRAQVDARVLTLLATADQGVQDDLAPLITLGLHHEQQHQELLLTDILHALSFNPQQPAYTAPWPKAKVNLQPVRWHAYEGGLMQHGFDAGLDGAFAFDNETPRHRVFIAPFELASRPVSNGEMMAFIGDRGYQRPELWLSMGWDWVTAGAHQLPLYWQGSAGNYRHFTLQGLLAVDPDAPVCHLSYFEADAFARWAVARLPTEFEWELAARALPAPAQLYGDVWEWTQSNYNPYPGYKAWEGVVGEYNGKFMCNQFVLRGGSCATPHSHIRASYRNFFPPDAQWQFSGLRLARNSQK
jgi:ergothioneine biosynthesis protein EgtB